MVKSSLEAHLHCHSIMPDQQYGFRKGRSTILAAATAQAEWEVARARGLVTAIAAFDLSSAFDTVDASHLLARLEVAGVRGRELSWLRSYLSGGRQYVDWDGVKSSHAQMQYGVRQGSILGPLLFTLLIADLPDKLGIDKAAGAGVVMYADDVTIWVSRETKEEAVSALQELATKFVDYATSRCLAVNIQKTQVMLTDASDQPVLMMAGERVQCQNVLNLLGIKIRSNLSLVDMQKDAVRSANRCVATVARLARHLPQGPYLRSLVKGLIGGAINYGAALAPPRLSPTDAGAALNNKMQVAINKVARIVMNVRIADKVPVETLLNKVGLPSYNRAIVRAIAMEAWKAWDSEDGGHGDRNTMGRRLFGSRQEGKSAVRDTRANRSGKIPPPPPPVG